MKQHYESYLLNHCRRSLEWKLNTILRLKLIPWKGDAEVAHIRGNTKNTLKRRVTC
jgi:hypothetical protein